MSEQFEVSHGDELDAVIKGAQDALAKDPSAPREVSVTVKFHKHEEYPKTLYKGKVTSIVQNADEEAIAAAAGFGPYDHEAFTAKEKE